MLSYNQRNMVCLPTALVIESSFSRGFTVPNWIPLTLNLY